MRSVVCTVCFSTAISAAAPPSECPATTSKPRTCFLIILSGMRSENATKPLWTAFWAPPKSSFSVDALNFQSSAESVPRIIKKVNTSSFSSLTFSSTTKKTSLHSAGNGDAGRAEPRVLFLQGAELILKLGCIFHTVGEARKNAAYDAAKN